DAAVAVAQLVGAAAERTGEDLVAEADPERRDPPGEHLPGQLHRDVGGGRVAGPVGDEEPVRGEVVDLLDRGVGGQHVHLDAAGGHHPRGVVLDPHVERGHPEPAFPDRGHDVGLGGGHRAVEVGALHRRAREHPLEQLGVGGQCVAGEHARPHGAALAQVAHHGAGVDAGDRDDALFAQRVLERAARAPVRGRAGGVAHHVAGHLDAAGLVVLVVPAGVADLRRGLHHDLAVVAGVGEGLLVAGHAGGEHRLAEPLAAGAVGLAAEDPSVLEDENRRHARTSSFLAVIRPRRTVAVTAAGSRIPSKGVLVALLAIAAPRTVHTASGSTTANVAGSPTAIGRPWSARPAICAGRSDITRATPRQSSRPGSTMVCTTTESAVSSPSIPGLAVAHSVSLYWAACGAWSVATTSMTPSASAARIALVSSPVRRGGLTLLTGS